MAVSLPLVMLILDFWPLGRFAIVTRSVSEEAESGRVGQASLRVRAHQRLKDSNGGPALATRSFPTLLLEKLPLAAMSVALCIKTLLVQHETVQLNASIPLASRAVNALMAYQAYVLRTFWPAGLAGHYPFPRQSASLPAICAAAGLLLVITILAVALRRTRPYLLAGWLWYLGMLVPVIGLVQVGRQAMADRYTYLPQIGLLWMVVFAVDDLLAAAGWHVLSFKRRAWRQAETRPTTRCAGTPAQGRATRLCLMTLLLTALIVASWRQTIFWRDDFTFMQRALECNEDDADMHNNMAAAFIGTKDFAAALPQAERAIETRPRFGHRSRQPGAHFRGSRQWGRRPAERPPRGGTRPATRGIPFRARQCLEAEPSECGGHATVAGSAAAANGPSPW